MPLRAIINNENIVAPLLSDDEWQSLKKQIKTENLGVRMICCDSHAYLRTSKHGFNHFVHKRKSDDCTSKGESWQHLKAKYEIVQACKNAGYDASTEIDGNGWRADVLATKGNAKVAFEVQWSRQSWEVTQERQQKFTDDGIRGCWLFKTPPTRYKATNDVPLFKLALTDDNDFKIIFNPRDYESWHEENNSEIPLKTFIRSLLEGKLRFCEVTRSLQDQKVRIVFKETNCWRCKKLSHFYYVDDFKSGCGEIVYIEYQSWEDDKYCFTPQIMSLVRQFIASPEGKHIKLGKVKKRYSKTINESYMSFGCYHCDALFGDFFLNRGEGRNSTVLEKQIKLQTPVTNSHSHYSHWCFPENGQFCC